VVQAEVTELLKTSFRNYSKGLAVKNKCELMETDIDARFYKKKKKKKEKEKTSLKMS